MVWCGNAAGNNGPVIFLLKGGDAVRKSRYIKKTYSDWSLEHVYGLPKGSTVLANSSAYMDDETWLECVKHLAPGIRKMPVIEDHPEWWACLTMDGYGSHVNVTEGLEIMSENKLHAAKEESGTSQICQSYDQHQARQDKQVTGDLTEIARGRVSCMDQWALLGVLVVGIKNMDGRHWENSFKKVNQHPDHRVSFDCWLDRIKEHITTGELNYFRTNEDYYYDAMPSCWKKLTVDDRREVVELMDQYYSEAKVRGVSPWSKENVISLTKFCSKKDVMKLRAAYFLAKRDETVITGERNIIAIDDDGEDDEGGPSDDDHAAPHAGTADVAQEELTSFMLKPPGLKKEELFKHMCDFSCRNKEETEKRNVSSYLNVEVSDQQIRFFQPTALDSVVGFIMKDASGKGARFRLPARRLNIIDGNISAYSALLNSKDRMKLVKEANELASVIGAIDNEREQEKEEKKRRKLKEEALKLLRREKRDAQAAEKHREALETSRLLIADVEQYGEEHFNSKKVNKQELVNLIRYFFGSDEYKDDNNKEKLKNELIPVAIRLYSDYKHKQEQQDTTVTTTETEI